MAKKGIHPLVTDLGQVIREHRKRMGFSQEGFGDHVELHRTYIGSIERGEQNLTVTSLAQVAEAPQTKPSTLLAEAENLLKD